MQERGKVQARNIGLDPGLPGLDPSPSFEPEQEALGSPERPGTNVLLSWAGRAWETCSLGIRNAWPVKPARNLGGPGNYRLTPAL